ncbi:transposase, partial [Mobiluncus mulieris]|nr:transposase [Mobiluncus mulieris]
MKLERERREAESKGAMTSTQWAKENAALRREVARLRMENEFLEKASAIDAS